MNEQTLSIIGIAVLVAVAWFVMARRRSARIDFHKVFDVDPNARLVQADMGRDHDLPNKILFADGLAGKPDVVFEDGDRLIVGEFKSGRFRGRIRRRDQYQITLYMGMLKNKHPQAQLEGRLVYTNERQTISFDPELYRELLTYRAECLSLLNKAGL